MAVVRPQDVCYMFSGGSCLGEDFCGLLVVVLFPVCIMRN